MNNRIENNSVYLADYVVCSNKPLYLELAKITGFGRVSALEFLSQYNVAIHTVSYNECDAETLKSIEQKLNSKKIDLKYGANYKNRGQSLHGYTGCYTVLSDDLKSTIKLDIKKQKDLNTYIGLRHSLNKKVHGQRTQSTGRKNKKVHGFQK